MRGARTHPNPQLLRRYTYQLNSGRRLFSAAVRTTHSDQTDISRQITYWWHEAENAVQSGQMARARRFLRWIVASRPEEEEAWLTLARLTPGSDERITILREAYRHHTESQCVQAALREARQHQLESGVGELKPRRAIPHCLPNERQFPERADAVSGNGHGPSPGLEPGPDDPPQAHPLAVVGLSRFRPFASLSRLLQRQPSPEDGDRSNGQPRDVVSRWDAWPY